MKFNFASVNKTFLLTQYSILSLIEMSWDPVPILLGWHIALWMQTEIKWSDWSGFGIRGSIYFYFIRLDIVIVCIALYSIPIVFRSCRSGASLCQSSQFFSVGLQSVAFWPGLAGSNIRSHIAI